MKLLTSFTIFALIGLLSAAPTSNEGDDDKVVITKSVYVDEFVKYTAKHDIVNLVVPLNALNVDEDLSESDEFDSDVYIFFVEADTDAEGNLVEKGLYVLRGGEATKLLDHGRVSAASVDNSKEVYFGAKDGLYVYHYLNNTAEKFTPITDSIIGLAKEKEGDVIYILTENHELYKASVSSGEKEKLEDVVTAKQIMLDYTNNLYFYSDDKQPYVRNSDGVSKIQGLPETLSNVNLVRPPIFVDNSVLFVADNTVYILYANGTSEPAGFEFKPKAKPTAYAPEAGFLQYYAYDKKIYEYNILVLILGALLEDFEKYFAEKSAQINAIAANNKKGGLRKRT